LCPVGLRHRFRPATPTDAPSQDRAVPAWPPLRRPRSTMDTPRSATNSLGQQQITAPPRIPTPPLGHPRRPRTWSLNRYNSDLVLAHLVARPYGPTAGLWAPRRISFCLFSRAGLKEHPPLMWSRAARNCRRIAVRTPSHRLDTGGYARAVGQPRTRRQAISSDQPVKTWR